MPLRETLSNTWCHVQGHLFPWLRQEAGPLTEQHQRLIVVLEMAGIERFVRTWPGLPGRPADDRHALARALTAKAVLGLPTTAALIERLQVDGTLRRLCGWERVGQVPGEWTFSRAFAEFAQSQLPARVHEALIIKTLGGQLVGHISRDATAIEARERPVRTQTPELTEPKRKRGRPKKGEVVPAKKPRRIETQMGQTLAQMLADLPIVCTIGSKRNAKGHSTSWIGYKLHIDTADGDIPVSCVLTSASVHDSQVARKLASEVAIPLGLITAARVTNLYDLMDSAYDVPEIKAHSASLGHVPIIDHKTRRGEKGTIEAEARAKRSAGYRLAEDIRYNERSGAERVNSALKDSYGGRTVRVRGAPKVFCHLMFGILAQTVEQLMRLIQ